MKLGDVETRVAHEAVPNPNDVKLLSHLTADLKRDSRCVRLVRVCDWMRNAACSGQTVGH